MKLRQKLAMVLASAMVLTAVPVVTFAASDNRTTNVVQVTKETVLDAAIAPELVVDLKDGMTSGSSFYVTLENATFEKAAIEAASNADVTFAVTGEDKKEVQVTANKELTGIVRIPMLTKVGEGEAKAIIEGTKAVTGGTYVFATTQKGSAVVTIGEMNNFYAEGGQIADIEITESVVGALAGTADKNDKVEIRVELENPEFEFNKASTVVLNKDRGFGKGTIKADVAIEKDEITITMNKADLKGTEKGRITLSGITVKTDKKAPTVGDLNVSIISDVVEAKEYKVANIAEYGTKLTVKDDKEVAITAGRDAKVTFTLKQNVKDSIVAGRTIDFTIEGGYIFGQEVKAPEGLEIIDLEFKKDDKNTKMITGFTAKVNTVKDKYEFADVKVVGELGTEGAVTVKAEGRAIGQELSLVVANVASSIKVDTKAAQFEVGVREQKAGKITITETAKDMIQKGNIVINLEKENGISFTDEPEVKVVSGDIKLGEAKLDEKAGTLTIPVTRTSREASVIEIANFPVKIDRTVPNGGYDIEIAGNALTNEFKTVDKDNKEVVANYGIQKVEDFFIVGELSEKVTTTITNGATEMVVNGEKVKLDAPAYLENGKMMVPLRAVAEAFGIQSKDIVYSAGNIVIIANGRTIQLTIGSKEATVNGVKMTLANPAKIVNERTTVPVGDVARLLGIGVTWDNAAKTATFKN